MKTCFKCGQSKPLNEFYAHPRCRQGTLNKCKECTKIDVGLHYQKMMQDPQWVAKERKRQRIKESRRRAEGVAHKTRPECVNAWRKRNPQKSRAQGRVAKAIRKGSLVSRSCEVCGSSIAQAHHDDYSRPLDVRWLCAKHHAEHHVKARLIEMGVTVL